MNSQELEEWQLLIAFWTSEHTDFKLNREDTLCLLIFSHIVQTLLLSCLISFARLVQCFAFYSLDIDLILMISLSSSSTSLWSLFRSMVGEDLLLYDPMSWEWSVEQAARSSTSVVAWEFFESLTSWFKIEASIASLLGTTAELWEILDELRIELNGFIKGVKAPEWHTNWVGLAWVSIKIYRLLADLRN